MHEDLGAGVLLGHTRLAVLDVSHAADQPMSSRDGLVTLVFNGEIYNFRELRKELEGQGVRFKSSGDTEVLLEGYLHWGEGLLGRLRGMFTLALWDARSKSALLVRDRLGIKPLFYAFDRGTLRFGSELKAVIAQHSGPKVRPEAIGEYLTWLYVPTPGTFYRDIQELPPAHLLRWSPGKPSATPERYWRLALSPRHESFEDASRELRRLLEEAVALHLVSDVPLGAFLSGGLDSTTLVALMAQRSSQPVRTFCMTFGEGLYDERQYARMAAERYRTQHEEIPVSPRVADLLPKLVHHFDQPFGNPTALLVYELSRLTRQRVTVALAGDGGDEVMLGYPRYAGLALARLYAIAPLTLRRAVAKLAESSIRESSRGLHGLRRAREFLTSAPLPSAQAYASWVSYLGAAELGALMAAPSKGDEGLGAFVSLFEEGPAANDPAAAAAAVDLQTFLPGNLLTYSDRMSMAHGLEVRVPFCDHLLVEYCAALPASVRMRRGRLKALMKHAMRDLLPPAVLRRRKLGFNPPMARWLQSDLRPLVAEYLSPKAVRERGLFNINGVERLLTEHQSGRRDHSLRIWSLIVLEEWQRAAQAPRSSLEEARKWA